jgi:hypothetical protein
MKGVRFSLPLAALRRGIGGRLYLARQMPEKPYKIKKRLNNTTDNAIKKSAEDLICIPRPLYLQMIQLLKGTQTNAGRAKNLLAELPLADKTE